MHPDSQLSFGRRTRVPLSGFSLLEALIVIAILGVVASIAWLACAISVFRPNTPNWTRTWFLFNQAIKVYLAYEGDLTGVTDPQAIWDKLKTHRNADSAAAFAGLSDSMIDKRLQARMQSTEESASDTRLAQSGTLQKAGFELPPLVTAWRLSS